MDKPATERLNGSGFQPSVESMPLRPSPFLFVAAILASGVSALAGCGVTSAGAVRPALPNAKTALGEEGCSLESATPLVVDLPAHQRAELEASLRKGGTLLASFDCRELRILPDCRAENTGSYDYEPVTLKEEVVRMTDAESVRARLPTMGVVLAAKLEGTLARGSSLDLGLAMLGRWTTKTRVVFGEELPAPCRSATHFVRTVPAGAFAMSVGSRAKVRAVAEIFGAGADAESDSTYVRDTRDGDLASCRAAGASSAPTPACSAPLRVELQRLDPRTEARGRCESDGTPEACWRWSAAIFERKADKSEIPALMTRLVALCREGRGWACGEGARSAERFERERGWKVDADRTSLEERACALDDRAVGCQRVIERLEKQGKADEALQLRERACIKGGTDCAGLADLIERGRGPGNPAERRQFVADLRARACIHQVSECNRYVALYRQGLRARGDFPTALIEKQCERAAKTGDAFACTQAAAGYAFGLGVPQDLARAKRLYGYHCASSSVRNELRGQACELPKDWQ